MDRTELGMAYRPALGERVHPVGVIGAALSFLGEGITTQFGTIVGSLAPAILAVVVLWYLYKPEVRAAFGRR